MECPICLRPVHGHDVESLARHLRETHDFKSLDAGRTAKRVQEWDSYDASRFRSVKGSPDAAARDDSGRAGEPDRHRAGMGSGEHVAVDRRLVVAGPGVSIEFRT